MSRVLRAWMLLLLALGSSTSLWAQDATQTTEYRVKAAYLYKFLGFVEWPPQAFERADSPLVIGVMGADKLADELALVVASRSANGRAVVTRKVRHGETLAGLHMLFVGRAEDAMLADLLAAASRQSLLVVTESDHAFALGSDINFVVVDDKVRFDVALHPPDEGSLKISSRLLAVARRVLASRS